MTTELWCVLGFAAWGMLLAGVIAMWRTFEVLAGKKKSNEFPAGVEHGTSFYWRINRAHINTVENLPIFAAIFLTARIGGVTSPDTAMLAQIILGARVMQSLVHISSGSAMAVNVRFAAFLTQWGCLAAMLVIIARNAW